MTLVFLKAQHPGELKFYLVKNIRGQVALILRPGRDCQMISLLLGCPDVGFLYCLHFINGQVITVLCPAAEEPAHESFLDSMTGIGDVVGQTSVVVVLCFTGDVLADHIWVHPVLMWPRVKKKNIWKIFFLFPITY